ncbi:MAG TPA: hypothetical protein VEF06_06600 [Bryobacteraceae bacterium]|nr:hypothetical protein [Bryobacteraceae bacterium]
MSPRDTGLPQITDSPRDTAEVTSLVPAEVQTVHEPQPAAPASAEIHTQLRKIQSALEEERALRLEQAELAARQVEVMRRRLEAVVEARAEDRRVWSGFLPHVLVPVGMAAVLLFLFWSVVFHASSPDSRNSPPPPAAPQAAPVQATPEAPAAAPQAEEPVVAPSPETFELARLNGALRIAGDEDVPEMLSAVNRWVRFSGAGPCWVTSASGSVSFVISSRDAGHPLLAALSRCADAVEHVTRR